MQDDCGDEGTGEEGRAVLGLTGASKRVAPQTCAKDVRGQREQRARDPNAAVGMCVQHESALDGGEPEGRRRRIGHSVVGLVELRQHQRWPCRHGFAHFLHRCNDEEHEDQCTALACGGYPHVEARQS